MPIINWSPPDIANMASRLPDPLQRPGGFIGRLLSDMVGADDPMSALYPTSLVSIYKNVAGVPSAALRQQGTKDFIRSFVEMDMKGQSDEGLDNLFSAVDWLAKKYPRVAAHMRMNPEIPDEMPSYYSSGNALASVSTPPGQVQHPITMNLSRAGISNATGT